MAPEGSMAKDGSIVVILLTGEFSGLVLVEQHYAGCHTIRERLRHRQQERREYDVWKTDF